MEFAFSIDHKVCTAQSKFAVHTHCDLKKELRALEFIRVAMSCYQREREREFGVEFLSLNQHRKNAKQHSST